jgi:predicted aspartyl protease
VLEVDGRQVRASLDGRVSASKKTRPMGEVQIRRDQAGMYSTVGSINGLPVNFLVDMLYMVLDPQISYFEDK